MRSADSCLHVLTKGSLISFTVLSEIIQVERSKHYRIWTIGEYYGTVRHCQSRDARLYKFKQKMTLSAHLRICNAHCTICKQFRALYVSHYLSSYLFIYRYWPAGQGLVNWSRRWPLSGRGQEKILSWYILVTENTGRTCRKLSGIKRFFASKE